MIRTSTVQPLSKFRIAMQCPMCLRSRIAIIAFAIVLYATSCCSQDRSVPGLYWLALSEDARVAYVYGYVWGYQGGFYKACQVAEAMWVAHPKGLPGHDCAAKMDGLPKTPEDSAKIITQYYRSYPADCGVPVRRLLEALLSSTNITVPQLHERYGASAKKIQTP